MNASRYPVATWLPSRIAHPKRPTTWGVTMHWTAGHEPGDIIVLRGPNVDVQFYVTKRGKVYQFVDADRSAWHGKATANNYSIGIETEGSGEAWTPEQLDAIAKLSAWIVREYDIPVVHTFPRAGQPASFRGFFGHGDLTTGEVDHNDHTDTVPKGTGWDTFLSAVRRELSPLVTTYYYERLVDGKTDLTWGPYKQKVIRDLRYGLTQLAHPTWVLRKYNKKEKA